MITITGDPSLIAFLALTWLGGLFAMTWLAAPHVLRWLARKTTPPLKAWDDDRSESARAMLRGFRLSWPPSTP